MALDPDDPPIWLRKLHVAASQYTLTDYAATPEAGLLDGCTLSDAVREWSLACAKSLGHPSPPPAPPFLNPFGHDQAGQPGLSPARAERASS